MSKGYRILFVGDPGQLPPIGDSPGILDDPDFTLTEIHRQKGNAELLDFVHGIRAGSYLPDADGEVVTKWPRWDEEGVEHFLRQSDVVLCYRNSTRHRLNRQLLAFRGLVQSPDFEMVDLWPQLVGKTFRIVGLRNYIKLDLYNGTEADFRLDEVTEFGLRGCLVYDLDEITVILSKAGFLSETISSEDRSRRDRVLADFGYCLTAHKSQGSEWPHVVVYDDTYIGMEHHARWCYTAATRAQQNLTWIHNGPKTSGPQKTIAPA